MILCILPEIPGTKGRVGEGGGGRNHGKIVKKGKSGPPHLPLPKTLLSWYSFSYFLVDRSVLYCTVRRSNTQYKTVLYSVHCTL